MKGDNCSSACETRDHETWGECVRGKGLRVAYAQSWKGYDSSSQKRADKRLDQYASARAQGIQPKSTSAGDVAAAVQFSDKTGTAFRA